MATATLPRPIDKSKLPDYELLYFDTKGRGEITRMLMAIAGVSFVDRRLPIKPPAKAGEKPQLGEEWKQIKDDIEKVPLGQVPVLVIKPTKPGLTEKKCAGRLGFLDREIRLPQSGAINRYLAKKFSLLGSDEVESALIDAVYETQEDWRTGTGFGWHKPKEEIVKYLQETYSKQAQKMDKFIAKHGGEDGVIGNRLSLADIALFQFIDNYNTPDFVDPAIRDMLVDITRKQAPVMTRCIQRVQDLPEVRKYLQARDGKFEPMM